MRYKELEVWKRSYRLCLDVYAEMKVCRDYGFKDQICRSSVSIASNIAEGSERGSAKDNIRFLHIAKGSCAELATQVLLAGDFGYMEQQRAWELEAEAVEIGKMLGGYIKYLARKNA